MCVGTIIWLGIGRVVVSDGEHYSGNEELLEWDGVDILTIQDEGAFALFERYLSRHPEHSFCY